MRRVARVFAKVLTEGGKSTVCDRVLGKGEGRSFLRSDDLSKHSPTLVLFGKVKLD